MEYFSLCRTPLEGVQGIMPVLVDAVETVHIHPIFILGGDKELGCFHDLLREDKRGNGRVNQKTSGFKVPVYSL